MKMTSTAIILIWGMFFENLRNITRRFMKISRTESFGKKTAEIFDIIV